MARSVCSAAPFRAIRPASMVALSLCPNAADALIPLDDVVSLP